MTYKVLIIGLGQIGMGYDLNADPLNRIATLARAFSEHHEFELAAGVDLDNTRRKLFEEQYLRPAFTSIEIALQEASFDIVAIAVPTELHSQVLLQVVHHDTLKAILCEKPLSYDLTEARQMIKLAEKSGIKLFTNYMRRCDQAVVEVRRRILTKEITGAIKGICWYSKGIFNNGSHFLNLFQFWFGDVKNFQIIDSGRLWAAHDPEPDLKIEFETGTMYMLAAREEDFSHYTVELIASNGRLRFERASMEWQPSVPDSNNQDYVVLDKAIEKIKSDAQKLQWYVADQISRSLSGENTSICTGNQGLATLEVLEEIKDQL